MIKSGLLTVALVFASDAAAQSREAENVVRNEQVSYTAVDFVSASAQSALHQRIRAAADRVCDLGGMQALEQFSASSNCFRRAVAEGYQQMDALIAARSSGAVVAASSLMITAK